jgi:hypothetical protein
LKVSSIFTTLKGGLEFDLLHLEWKPANVITYEPNDFKNIKKEN